MHSGGFELTELTYTRLEDNLVRHRGDRTQYHRYCYCTRYFTTQGGKVRTISRDVNFTTIIAYPTKVVLLLLHTFHVCRFGMHCRVPVIIRSYVRVSYARN